MSLVRLKRINTVRFLSFCPKQVQYCYMSSKYRFSNKEGIYFITATVVGWADVFTRNVYRHILLDSFRYCQQQQGLNIHAWVLMPNHYHLICSCKEEYDLGRTIRNSKSYTALKMIDALINNVQESRREWLLPLFEKHGALQKSSYRYQFWQHENHPILLDDGTMYNQRLNYLHQNPVRAGFVSEPQYWLYNSALDSFTKEKGLLDLMILE